MSISELGRLSPSAVGTKAEEIWKDVLGVSDGQAGATFFELSGQSIAAVLIVTRLKDELGVVIDVADLFEDPDLDTFVRDVVARVSSPATA